MTLEETVAGIAAQLPEAAVTKLAERIATLDGPSQLGLSQVKEIVSTPSFRSACDQLWDAWKVRPLPGVAVSAALHSACFAIVAERARLNVELVVTGPSSFTVPLRQTTAVLMDLIGNANESLWLVSFAAYQVPDIASALAAAVERGVDVHLLLETTDGGLRFAAAPAFAQVAERALFYQWPVERRPRLDKGHASLHAKALVADRRRAFVTSANFTGIALEHNLEIGVLLEGGEAPAALVKHLEALVEQKILVRVN